VTTYPPILKLTNDFLLPLHNSSVASFLFPIFASYKALKTSDPAQLTPWLMYWVVFSCCLLAESWVSFILTWYVAQHLFPFSRSSNISSSRVPFYGYIRLLFFLYLILPQTQGARVIYEEHIHPFLQENEAHIDEFIASAHERLKTAGIAYFRHAIAWLREHVLGMPPQAPEPPAPTNLTPQSYTQSLLARFSIPTARWAGEGAASAGSDFYSLLASAVSAAGNAATRAGGGGGGPEQQDMTASGNLIPPHLRDSGEKMSFIAAQRERLSFVLAALDREAQNIQNDSSGNARVSSMSMDGNGDADEEMTQRPPSGLSMFSALSKSRSEADFEKIEAESGAEEDIHLRRRHVSGGPDGGSDGGGGGGGGSWMPWGWGLSPQGSSARDQ
jgi:hypothetical protein